MAEKQFVIFKLDTEEYGIDIMNVREIAPYQDVSKVPNTPKFIEGVINFRGVVIPIINLKKRFSLSDQGIQPDTRLIVINLEDKQIGFIVDEASETVRLDDSEIEPAPDLIAGVDRSYILGVGKKDKRLIILIDLVKILSADEIEKLKTIDEN